MACSSGDADAESDADEDNEDSKKCMDEVSEVYMLCVSPVFHGLML